MIVVRQDQKHYRKRKGQKEKAIYDHAGTKSTIYSKENVTVALAKEHAPGNAEFLVTSESGSFTTSPCFPGARDSVVV